MQPEFWHDRWQRNQIGFHQEQVNPCLERLWPQLELLRGARVLVPLCGKSLDLSWLAASGFEVLGVELSQTAVEQFFSEQRVTPQVREQGGFKVYEAGPVTIICGDFFALSAADVAGCAGLYDRAAIIALPPQMRKAYALHLSQILPRDCRGLLITLDYDQHEMKGPPFSVPDDEVQQLLAPAWSLQIVEQPDVLGQNWKFLKGGASRLVERVYRVCKTA
ncbi:thiopurine S-methyltransferase [Pseudomonas versuta]|uniref:Thiopurine S-methyltransferase n=1 Tax=Pseudomonas versuta TaxID=1788301 RepID=A0A0M4R2H1_9PSED|nr:thiopurine S-methyltransferase [Pseudomonas versuta]ALE87356.1 thiopurine S-methyltransferase [Pseudomonas versuta]OKA20070.1 thiopurine S-methyltransferase [Pseudomonas versuta]OKA27606.1 thiopurine S-methyltransferase [Pseudomonas versuta]